MCYFHHHLPFISQQRISKILLNQFKNICLEKNFNTLVVPVRPTMKSSYPLIPIEKYVNWKNPDGLIFDPWLRIHFS